MQISQNLKLKQSQSLVMTPQLQQAIKLLQLNNLELSNLINKELEENPFLENQNSEEVVDVKEEKTYEIDESFSSGESQSDEPKNEDYENRWDVETSCMNYSRNTNNESLDPGSIVEQTYAEKVTLKSILTNQAHLEFSNEKDRRISEILIDYIEPSGWFLQSLDEIESFSGFERNAIESVLKRMQKFEPSGVFARNLKECLSIQLQNTDYFSEKNITVVENL